MKSDFDQQDLLEMIFNFKLKSGYGGYEENFKIDEEKVVEEAKRTKIRELYQKVSSRMCISPFKNLDKHNKKRILKYVGETKCSLEEAVFSIFY